MCKIRLITLQSCDIGPSSLSRNVDHVQQIYSNTELMVNCKRYNLKLCNPEKIQELCWSLSSACFSQESNDCASNTRSDRCGHLGLLSQHLVIIQHNHKKASQVEKKLTYAAEVISGSNQVTEASFVMPPALYVQEA